MGILKPRVSDCRCVDVEAPQTLARVRGRSDERLQSRLSIALERVDGPCTTLDLMLIVPGFFGISIRSNTEFDTKKNVSKTKINTNEVKIQTADQNLMCNS